MNFLILIFLYNYIATVTCFWSLLGPIGVGLSGVAINSYCYFKECCNQNGIPADLWGLERDLRKHVFGQHLVQDIVVNAIRGHWKSSQKSPKALTLSFHGWPGGGKNYVAQFIISSLYKYGSQSQFVHVFHGRLHFPSEDRVHEYQENLSRWIMGNMTKCSKQIFIFDEVDKIPSKVLDILKPYIDYKDYIGGVDYRDAIFIFLSNTGADLINEHYLDLWNKKGIKREDLKLQDFEHLITQGAFNEEGGFYHSDTIKSNLIDHYIPFLPMERHHVKLCIKDEFNKRNVTNPSEEHIKEVMDFIAWGPSKEKLFSQTGCKRVSQKVALLVARGYY